MPTAFFSMAAHLDGEQALCEPFTSYSPQLGVLVLVGLIVDADQDIFDGLRHDWVRVIVLDEI
jgi:hypothetical protein